MTKSTVHAVYLHGRKHRAQVVWTQDPTDNARSYIIKSIDVFNPDNKRIRPDVDEMETIVDQLEPPK